MEACSLLVCLSVFYLIEQVEFFWQLLADVDLLYFLRGQPQHREPLLSCSVQKKGLKNQDKLSKSGGNANLKNAKWPP